MCWPQGITELHFELLLPVPVTAAVQKQPKILGVGSREVKPQQAQSHFLPQDKWCNGHNMSKTCPRAREGHELCTCGKNGIKETSLIFEMCCLLWDLPVCRVCALPLCSHFKALFKGCIFTWLHEQAPHAIQSVLLAAHEVFCHCSFFHLAPRCLHTVSRIARSKSLTTS